MAISITQSSQIEFSDWLGVTGTTRRRGTCFFHKIRANPRLKKRFKRKLEQTQARKSTC
jgi:hypothetical protein